MKQRKRSARVNFWLTPEEKAQLEELAASTGRGVSDYLRAVALGYRPKSILDRVEVKHLQQANADIARLGTLLNAWLGDDKRVREVAKSNPEQLRGMLRLTLSELGERQGELRAVISRVINERGGSEGPEQ